MKRILALFSIALIYMTSANAQTRYIDEVFPNIKKTANIKYGANPKTFDPNDIKDLFFDLYEPDGDQEFFRPIIILAHEGGFRGGNKEDNELVAFANAMVKRGYVVASITYRKGWAFALSNTQEQNARAIVPALWRAMQDGKAAVRFFRRSVQELGNPYRIDPNKIAFGGFGAGGYIPIQNEYFDTPQEFNLPKVQRKNNAGVPDGSGPYIDSTAFNPQTNPNGEDGFEGRSGSPGFSWRSNVILNFCAALGDTAFLFPQNQVPGLKYPPIITVQGDQDGVTPYATDIVRAAGLFAVLEVSGGYDIARKLSELGINKVLEGVVDGLPDPQPSPDENFNPPRQRIKVKEKGTYTLVGQDYQPYDAVRGAPSTDPPANSAAVAARYMDTLIRFTVPRLAVALGLTCSNPVVTNQPDDVTACTGGPATFTINASGADLVFQWRKGNTNLANNTKFSGVNSPTLNINSVEMADAGEYNCVVTSVSCNRTSTTESATLTVNPAPSITNQPSSVSACENGTATFTVGANGSNLTFQWRRNGVNLSNNTKISGATTATLTITGLTAADEGNYTCVVNSGCPTGVTSNAANLTLSANEPPMITAQPNSTDACTGQQVRFSINATGTNLSFFWKKDGVDIGEGGRFSGTNTRILTIQNVNIDDEGSYTCTVVGGCDNNAVATSNAGVLNIDEDSAPTITEQPQSKSVCPGETVTFEIDADGSGLKYQWQFNGANIPGETNTTLTILNVSSANAGVYRCVVSGECGSTVTTLNSADANLAVGGAPQITAQPSNVTACSGGTASFSVAVDGNNNTFQWFKNGVAIQNGSKFSGTSSASLQINNIEQADAGNYTCEITSPCNTKTTTQNATLAIGSGSQTFITAQANNNNVCVGGTATFSIGATGTNLTYRWRKGNVVLTNGGKISGANSANLVISNVESVDAGQYNVIVTGGCNNESTQTSRNVSLNVSDETFTVTSQPTNQATAPGGSATFSVSANGMGITYQWMKNGNDLVDVNNISGARSPNLTISNATKADEGNYACVITNNCGVRVVTSFVTLAVGSPTSVRSRNALAGNVQVFPNPAVTDITIKMSNFKVQKVDIKLVDITGKTVLERKNISTNEELRMERGNLAEGVYYLQILSNGLIKTEKIIFN